MNKNRSVSTKTFGIMRKITLSAAIIGLAFAAYGIIFNPPISPNQNTAISRKSELTAQVTPGSMEVDWDTGSPNCANSDDPEIQVHQYNSTTYILRQNPCADFEAPFMYLLIGETRAFLLDTGAVRDAPIANIVMDLLDEQGQPRLPLVVAHSHGHFDHRRGDEQFLGLENVVIIGNQSEEVQNFFGFDNWPKDPATFELGGRSLEILPIPGHHPAGIAVYDTVTGLLLTGDNLLPGRVYIFDLDSFRASSQRLVQFIENRAVTHVLGGHLEMDKAGKLFKSSSNYRPDQRDLQMTRDNVLGFDQAISNFGFFSLFSTEEDFVLVNNGLIMKGLGVLAFVCIFGFIVFAFRFVRRRRRKL